MKNQKRNLEMQRDFFLFFSVNGIMQTMKAENLLFDFNGTLVNDLDLCIDLLNRMLQLRNHPCIDRERYLEIFDFPVIEYYKKAGFRFPEDRFDELSRFFIEEYTKGNPHCTLCDGAEEVLKYYKAIGKHLYIVSASERSVLERQLELYRIRGYFEGISALDNILAASKIESAKAFMNWKGIVKKESVLIGDTLHDAEVAAALGVRCVLIAQGHQSKERLLKSGAPVLNTLRELETFLE